MSGHGFDPYAEEEDDYGGPGEQPELPRSTCRNCGQPIVWMVTRNARLIPVQPDTALVDETSDIADNPNRAGELLYVFAYKIGHRAHFDHCTAATDNQPPKSPPRAKTQDDIFNKRNKNIEQFYAELGLLTSAEPEVIKAAHRALVLLYHPDRNPNGNERIARINVAYEKIMENL